MPTFTDFPLVDRDLDSPLNEDVIDVMHQRDEELRERPFFLDMADSGEISVETYGAALATFQIYVPEAAAQLVIAVQAFKHNATSAQVECRIGGLTSSEVTTTNTSYGTSVFAATFSDVSTIIGTEITMTLHGKRTGSSGGSPHMHCRIANGPACYFVE